MPATISPERQRTEHRTPEQHPRAEADYSADDLLSSEALEEPYLYNAAPSEGFIGAAGYYERFLGLPPAVGGWRLGRWLEVDGSAGILLFSHSNRLVR